MGGVNAPAAWDLADRAPRSAGVIDTGITQHPELAGRVLPADFISDPALANDGNGRDSDPSIPATTPRRRVRQRRTRRIEPWHGTFVSGLIAANTNNDDGIAGMDWNARILPVRVLAAVAEP